MPAPQPQYRFPSLELGCVSSDRFGLWTVQTTRTVRGFLEHSPSSQSLDTSLQPLEKINENPQSILWSDAAECPASRSSPGSWPATTGTRFAFPSLYLRYVPSVADSNDQKFQRTRRQVYVGSPEHAPSYPREPKYTQSHPLSNTERRILNRVPRVETLNVTGGRCRAWPAARRRSAARSRAPRRARAGCGRRRSSG